MRRFSLRLLVFLAGAAGVACSSNDSGSTVPDLTGTWSATAYTYTNASNSSQVVDVLAGGFTAKIIFTGQTYLAVTTGGGQAADTAQGSYTETANTISLTDGSNGKVVSFTMALNGTTLTLTNGTGTAATFDFGSGKVAAVLNLTLKKQ